MIYICFNVNLFYNKEQNYGYFITNSFWNHSY